MNQSCSHPNSISAMLTLPSLFMQEVTLLQFLSAKMIHQKILHHHEICESKADSLLIYISKMVARFFFKITNSEDTLWITIFK